MVWWSPLYAVHDKGAMAQTCPLRGEDAAGHRAMEAVAHLIVRQAYGVIEDAIHDKESPSERMGIVTTPQFEREIKGAFTFDKHASSS